MIRMNIVMKSGAILEAIATDEESYKGIADSLVTEEDAIVVQTEGFFDVFIKPGEVAAVTAELLDDDDESDEASGDDDEESEDDDDAYALESPAT